MKSGSNSEAHGRQPSLEYMKVRRLHELKVVKNIRQGGVCCVCVEYLYELGYGCTYVVLWIGYE